MRKIASRMIAGFVLAGLGGMGGVAFAQPAGGQTFSSDQWFAPAEKENQVKFETALNAIPTPARLRAWHELLGSEPHVAGTPGDARQIERMVQAFEVMGLTVETHEFWAYLCRPVEAQLQIIDEAATIPPAPEEGGQGIGDAGTNDAAPVAHSPLPQSGRRGVVPLPLREDDLLDDPYEMHPDLTYGWNAYSGSGDVTAEVVYTNYGTKNDFAKLRALDIDCAGKIVIARYGGNFRGFKAKYAEEAGAAGVIIYTDPDDSGYRQGVTYPEGGWANETCIQRGSIVALDYPGDPLTPLTPATEHATRLDPAEVALPSIPVQPIGYRAAQQIMMRMAGQPLPADLVKTWQGGLPCAYRLAGGAELKLRLVVKQERAIVKSANVIATLEGAAFPDQKVIIGCHHDAWGFGAGDPLAGTILVFEAARSFAELARQGLRPQRTIVFATWGAEEFGIIGSTEYCEANRDELMRSAVAYINLDAATMGANFGASAAPLLKTIIDEVARDVPQARDPAKSAFDGWRGEKPTPEIGNLGGGSDHIGFYCHLGIPSCGLGAGGAPGTAYHSNYDNLAWYRRTVGDDYEPALMMTRIVNLLAARLANATLLPLDPARYGRDLRAHLEALRRLAADAGMDVAVINQLMEAVKSDAAAIETILARLHTDLAGGALSADRLATINSALLGLERAWLMQGGLPGRPWFRSLYASSDPTSGYAAWMLPALRGAIEARDQARLAEATEMARAAFARVRETLAAVATPRPLSEPRVGEGP